MFRILVVDDSAFDRRLVTSILQKSVNYDVHSADNGEAALRSLGEQKFDLLITDLNMPQMGGLELLCQAHDQFSDLPSIVITACGSEATAMRALQAGAYSYVPKFHMADELQKTVAAVLKATTRQRNEEELLCSVVNHSLRLSIPSDRSRITPTIDYLQKLVTTMKLVRGSQAMHLGVALDEALSNAIIHGNLEVSSKLREGDGSAYKDLIEERQRLAPYADRRVTIDVLLDALTAKFVIRDEGPGFDMSSLPDPHDPENLLRASGRGITLMHAFLDEVTYNDKGNEVTLRLDAAAKSGTTSDTDVQSEVSAAAVGSV